MKWLFTALTLKPRCWICTDSMMISASLQRLLYHYVIGCRLFSGYKPKKIIKDCYRLLNVQEGCSLNDVRDSYRKLAKQYHPDSGSPSADVNKFVQIEEAYRTMLSHLAKEDDPEEKDEEEKFKHKVPQHRQYLNFEGVGFGTPSQREKQYVQFRVDRATDQVMDFRRQKLERQYAENAMMAKDVRQSKKIKITQAIERLVEDLIQESMARGDFDNLSGKGKPLEKFSYCPHIDPMTHNLNRILIDNGYQPEWIVLQKEIRETIEKLRKELVEARKKLGEPMMPLQEKQWSQSCEQFSKDIGKLNKRINDFNLIVPLLNRQMIHFCVDKEIARALKAHETLVRTTQKIKEDINTNDLESATDVGLKTYWAKLISLVWK
ncbi:dnaJ homolog subfamily C member 28 [Microcaecilia unicolor]|uniref:DnaJ homolog subfamily C member 28 n=1 Tax=Microcaecilia unicolor TaxID=1415580 RepID=A0A6P7XR10_9AMPH|nr:dnaJ homolog subfamily C member 28 [Microcaecilia unicolor]